MFSIQIKLTNIYLRVSHFRVDSFDSFVPPEGVERVSVDGESAGQVDLHHRHVAGRGRTSLDVIGANSHLKIKIIKQVLISVFFLSLCIFFFLSCIFFSFSFFLTHVLSSFWLIWKVMRIFVSFYLSYKKLESFSISSYFFTFILSDVETLKTCGLTTKLGQAPVTSTLYS